MIHDECKYQTKLKCPAGRGLVQPIDGAYFYITNEFLKVNSAKKYFIKNPPKSVSCIEDDILMTRTGNTGQVVTGVSGAFHNNFFKISYSSACDKWFLYYFLTSYKTQHVILKLAGTSTIPDLNHGDFYKIHINLPSLPEQQKIAAFLSAVDEKIRLLSRKKELLQQYKKGLMQKIFSREIRFTDENGGAFPEWEEKRLGDVGTTYNGLVNKTANDFGNGAPFVTYKQIFDDSKIDIAKFGLVKIAENENQNKVNCGDVFFTTSSETRLEVGFASVLLDNINELYLNSFCFGFRINSFEEFLPEFARYFFRSAGFRKEITKLGQGSTRYNMSKNEMKKLFIHLPIKKEQAKIANFLSAIDMKSEAVNSQLTRTQAFKKGLLQRMFV